jgi:hypothetical protein
MPHLIRDVAGEEQILLQNEVLRHLTGSSEPGRGEESEGFFDMLKVISSEGRLLPPFSSPGSATSTNPGLERT